MRSGRTEEAGAVATRVEMTIRRRNSVELRRADMRRGSREVWTKVRQLTKGQTSTAVVPAGITADVLNQHYASISTDLSYEPPQRKASCHRLSGHISEMEVFNLLDHLQPTATGLDLVPAWFLRLTAPVFSAPIAHLYNQSIDSAVVPTQWKRAFITPIPKVANPRIPADYRPISITPVLTRLLEKHIVRSYIYPHSTDRCDAAATLLPGPTATAGLQRPIRIPTDWIDDCSPRHTVPHSRSAAEHK